MKVLFLSQWYPNRYDAMEGLFVRKHAQAVARQGIEVYVLYICYDNRATQYDVEEEKKDGVKETVIYRPNVKNAIDEIFAIRSAWKIWNKKYGLPDIVHLNVVTKIGLLPIYLRRKYGIPYVITEHWSGYLPENGDYNGILRKKISKKIVDRAATIMPVSKLLKNAMINCGLEHPDYRIIYNVIDDFFYKKATEFHRTNRFRFLHVSCFDNRAKNTTGIIEALRLLSEKREDFEMIMVGTGQDINETTKTAKDLIDNKIIKFVGEQTPEEVKMWMDNSDCFVLFSNYETAAVVLEEAIACGLPIITTPVGIARDIITGENGKIVSVGNIKELSNEMSNMIENKNNYDREHIKKDGEKYSFENIGKQIVEIYNETNDR